MTTVNITEQSNTAKYLIITQQKDPSTLITTRVVITDQLNNRVRLVDVQRGPEGPIGPTGPQGPPGKDGSTFDILPISSGGTNNTTFTPDKIIYYDGSKLLSTEYSVQDILTNSNNQSITGIIEGTGISRTLLGSSVILNANLGSGLFVDNNNQIIVDDSIARRSDITTDNLSGILKINKGGTNNNVFNTNRLVYFDGAKLASFPLDTGRIVTSGSTISIVAGSGLIGGGSLSIPSGSVVLNIGQSSDILVSENIIELSTTGIAGTYTKVVTDIKGRVISGLSLSNADIINALGYTPWHAGNDGIGSNLDADLLDGQHGSYYLNFDNFSGLIKDSFLPDIVTGGTYSKVTVNNKGLILNGSNINNTDIINALGYRPVNSNGDTVAGNLNVNGKFTLGDNLPIFSRTSSPLLPNDPRGFSFVYGNSFKQTGILAYYPIENQLKLVTKIFGSGTNDIGGGDSTDLFNGEIDGGDANTVFLLGNLQGDQAIVLLQHIADSRYIRTTTNQLISGIKTFSNEIYVNNRINITNTNNNADFPINVGDNTNTNINLNSDLLDSEHGSFYRNASNLTGTLDYNTVDVSNLEGVVNYIAKFDDRTNNPSRTVSESIIRQSGSFNIIVENGSLSVGANNRITQTRSAAIGANNDISSQNSLAVGLSNTVKANNSVALNQGCTTNTINSVAMGKNGTTWLPNQLSIGAFEEMSPINNTTRIGLGQNSIASIGYFGVAPSYVSLSPAISIPTNKTLLYNIDLLFTKFAGTGAAAFSFQSGIIKNYSGTNAGTSATTILNPAQKHEIYNDSQIKDYLYAFELDANQKTQTLSVKRPPLQNNALSIQNLKNVYRIKPDLSELTGDYYTTFDGPVSIRMNKPVSSGSFSQTSESPLIYIKSTSHNMVSGCIADIKFTSGLINPLPPHTGYVVDHIVNDNEFTVQSTELINNSGYVNIIKKRNYYGSYKRFNAQFTRYDCSYSQYVANGFRTIYLTVKNSSSVNFLEGYDPYLMFLTSTQDLPPNGQYEIVSYDPPAPGVVDDPQLVVRIPSNESIATVVTGTVDLYTNYGVSNIDLYGMIGDANIANNEIVYIDFLSPLSNSRPVSQNYTTDIAGFNSTTTRSYHLMPDSGIEITGSFYLTIDRDHGFVPPSEKPNLLQQIPLIYSMPSQFTLFTTTPPYTSNNNINRLPKSGLFTITGVSGHSIYTNNYATSLFKEPSSFYFKDTFTTAPYFKNVDDNDLSIEFTNKQYFQKDDMIYCSFPDQFDKNQNFRITEVLLFENNSGIYKASPVESVSVPLNGLVSFVGASSGFVYSPINNVYFHSYGGRTESWGRDYSGKYIDPPHTGFFSIYNSSKLCNSGTICVHISGSGSFFENTKIGDKFYFDFIDATGFELKNVFPIHDKLSPNIFTLNIDKFNLSNENEKGIVYIIDSLENIKTNKNPNYDNVFLNSDVTASNDIYINKLSSFNDDTNRWKHCLTIPNTTQPDNYVTKFTVTTGPENITSTDTNVLVLGPDPMEVIIQSSINNDAYNNISTHLSVPSQSSLKLKIIVKNGAGKWSADDNICAPRINIIGIAEYGIANKTYNAAMSQWEILVDCGLIKNIYRQYNTISIIVSDESGRIIKDFNLSVTTPVLSSTQPQNIVYGYVDNPNLNWELIFETYGGNLSSQIQPSISLDNSTFPTNSNNYLISTTNNYPENWYTIKVIGSPGSSPGTYYPVITVSDGTSNINVTGSLIINENTQFQEYAIIPRKFNSLVSLRNNNLQARNFGFSVPVLDTSSANEFLVEFTNSDGLSITNPEYIPSHDMNIMSYAATISGLPGFYNPQLTIRTKQPSIDGVSGYILSTGLNVVISNDITISLNGLTQPIIVDSKKLWELDFSINTSDPNAKVTVGNTPNIGLYNIGSPTLEYNIVKTATNANTWKISVTGKPDFFGETAYRTGNFDLYIYAEDSVSSTTGIAKLNIIDNSFIINVDLNKYATPNNAFESNVDVGGLSSSSNLSLDFKSNISSDGAIIPYPTKYSKYDSNIKIWESCFKFEPVTEKWDAQLSLSNNNLLVRIKGITDDKLYVAGKVSTVETDNLNTLLKPLTIKNLQPQKEYKEGDGWEIIFSTEGGLESPLYPPMISFSGITPTPCSGYDPLLPVAPCVIGQGPKWDNDAKEWKYTFSGLPICTVQEFPLIVNAVDKILNQTFGTASSGTKIIYKSLGPQDPPKLNELENKGLYPNCQNYISDIVFYGPGIRKTCPVPTGISGVITSGTLPPGISFVNQSTFNPPYSNLGSGSFYFTGNATEFANGGTYPQKFKITVIDARGNSTSSPDIQFNDLSVAVPPSPTDITIYFANSGYQYTPKRISTADPPVQYPSGTLIIDDITTTLVRPPASSASMECLSILPHNECLVSDAVFEKLSFNETGDNITVKLFGSGTLNGIGNKTISDNDLIYVEFINDSASNKVYVAQRINPSSDYIHVKDNMFVGINVGDTGIAKILKVEDNIKNIKVSAAEQDYTGSPPMSVDPSTTDGILGDGKFAEDPDSQKKGFMGRIRPTLQASLSSGVYRETSEHLEDFNIVSLYPEDADLQHIHAIKKSNCYETAYLRVSGLLLPSFSIDTSDPPPAEGNFYTYDGYSDIAVAIRPAYGTGIERNNNLNRRAITNPGIECIVTNMMTNAVVRSGVESTTTQGGVTTATFVISNTIFSSTDIGTVFKLSLNYKSPYIFPTYNKNALSSAYNEYYWVHRGDFNGSPVDQNSFPPVIPVTKNNLIFFNDTNNSKPIQFIGGYIGETANNSVYQSYPPSVTGYLQYFDPVVSSGSYTQESNSDTVVINIPEHPFNLGDNIAITFIANEGSLPLDVQYKSETITAMDSSTISIPSMQSSPNSRSGFAIIKDLVSVETNPLEQNEIIITHRPGITSRLPLGESIDLIKYSNNQSKTSLMSDIFSDKKYLLKSTSRTSVGTIATLNQDIDDDNNYFSNIVGLCELRQNILLPGDISPLSFSVPHISITNKGESVFNITGIPPLTGLYNFSIITSENPDLLSLGIDIKKHIKDYNVSILNSIQITSTNNCVQFIDSQNWTYSFSVIGGRYPRSNYSFEIEVDHKIHTFTKNISIIDNNTVSVTIASKSMGTNYWTNLFQQKTNLKLKVYDDTSSDSVLITRCV